ncbi:transporter substrate-binding domain-containing protein [Acuticoccus sp. MNP-M23]|uniref:transporter substrate-binding domain-containing protein n=1 Tax=Acuticoccus sp. MNP-M23 TaxID=3072793 RepID=UPI002816353A|nr:transporter substrate-binding domain-containing protein [Acuticoccus sp. MNP-M23]WMS40882.1 transporter substrate-binding domain-containing protein [Acuticoccus sp. MNP-M23]
MLKHTIAAALALGLSAAPALAADPGPTVQKIMDRGTLLCPGHNGSYLGFAEVDDKGAWSGFDIEFCKALATAILGSPDAVQIIPVSFAQRFPAVQSGDIDVIIKVTGWTMSRDTELGLQFSRPYFIGPTNVLVRSDIGATSTADLEGGVFCINAGTSIERIVADYMGARGISYESLTFEKPEELRAALYNGRCDALAGFGPFLAATRFNAPDPDAFEIMDETLALEPESLAARQGDDNFIDVLNWLTNSLLFAEENGITQANVDEVRANPPSASVERFLGVSPGYGERLGLSDDWAYNVIKAVGNYAEIYDGTVGEGSVYKLPRGKNKLWSDGGLLYTLVLD